MDQRLVIDSREIFFIADSHFRDPGLPGEADRRRRFSRFLEQLSEGTSVFLLGDVFDFFFEYRGFVLKRYFDIFYALRRSADRGVAFHFLGGNHDYWVGDFLSNEIGIRTYRADDLIVKAQGRTLCCSHGDLMLPGDGNYRRVRAMIRNRYIISAAKILHPDVMNAIASRVSNGSRQRRRRTQEELARELRDIAESRFFLKGNDAFIMGHVHYPLLQSYGGRDFMIVGDWIRHFSYGHLTGGSLSLEHFDAA